jgi:hypothetical protein
MNYQRKTLPETDVGEPGPLPEELVGLADDSLADLSAALAPCPEQFVGQGFFPVAGPTPPAPAPILSPYDFLLLFTAAERVAILTAAQTNMQMADWLNMLNHVSFVHLDDPNTISGVEALEAAGLIGAGRAAQILADEAPT